MAWLPAKLPGNETLLAVGGRVRLSLWLIGEQRIVLPVADTTPPIHRLPGNINAMIFEGAEHGIVAC